MADKCSRCGGICNPTSGRCYICGVESFRITTGMEKEMYRELWPAPIIVSPETKLTGLSSSYYTLPEGCKELQDLIEYKNMNFARGNMFKAVYRLGDKPGTETIYDLEKIIWFAQREIERIKNESQS